MKIKQFKCRASAISQILTDPRSKNETLSETAKTYCQNWLKEQIYGREISFSSKYTKKGILVEQDSIDFVNAYLNTEYVKYTGVQFVNEYFTGMPDIITDIEVIDMKNAYDVNTFDLFALEAEKANAEQLQIYMLLAGKTKGKIIRTLIDMPEELLQSEARKLMYNESIEFEQAYEIVSNKFTYFDIPDKYKIKVFDIKYDTELIKKAQSRVIQCREYINSLLLTI